MHVTCGPERPKIRLTVARFQSYLNPRAAGTLPSLPRAPSSSAASGLDLTDNNPNKQEHECAPSEFLKEFRSQVWRRRRRGRLISLQHCSSPLEWELRVHVAIMRSQIHFGVLLVGLLLALPGSAEDCPWASYMEVSLFLPLQCFVAECEFQD